MDSTLTITTKLSSLKDCYMDDYISEELNEETVEQIIEELEPLTYQDPIESWIDRIIEHLVDIHKKQFVADTYKIACDEGVKCKSQFYNKKNIVNQAKREYIGLYADFYKICMPKSLLSTSEITLEAEQWLSAYTKSNDPAGYHHFLLVEFFNKFEEQIKGVIMSSDSRSMSISPNSFCGGLSIGVQRNLFLNARFETIHYEEDCEESEQDNDNSRKRYRPNSAGSCGSF